MNAQMPGNDSEGNVVVSDEELILASERCHCWLVASDAKACL
jgi:hypothetical protein